MAKILEIGVCPDCDRKDVKITTHGICEWCLTRKNNAIGKGREYRPFNTLTDKEKERSLKISQGLMKYKGEDTSKSDVLKIMNAEVEVKKEINIPDNIYQLRAEQKPITEPQEIKQINLIKPTDVKIDTNFQDILGFIKTLEECGCEVPENTLSEILKVLIATDTLKDTFLTIAKSDNQQAILDLEQILNVGERKLQHVWEYGGFKEEDDIKFKNFLTWRRVLKGAIFFWKKLYESNTLIELEKAWNAYTQDPSEKVVLSGDRTSSVLKRYQITTESYSTILNTRRPFTRVFYAKNKDEAYEAFVQWMSDRQLHETKNKTIITELSNETK